MVPAGVMIAVRTTPAVNCPRCAPIELADAA